MTVFITGARGFIGHHLMKMLKSIGVEVLSPDLDITDVAACESYIGNNNFDVLVHLAGVSSVQACESDISKAFRVNVESTYRIATLAAKQSNKVHFVFPSTGQVYGGKSECEQNHTYVETDPVSPRNLYALTKYLAEEELRIISENSGLSVTALRIFNHAHKSQRPDFFLSSVYHQILAANVEGRKEAKISVGNIDVSRDFGAIQDLLNAFLEVIHKGAVVHGRMNLFNVSSGVGKNLRSLIKCLSSKMEIKVECVEREDLKRSNEPQNIVASNKKFVSVYNWRPRYSLSEEQLIDAFLADL